MRLGVLDVGSNSSQLQIVDATSGSPPLPALAIKTPTIICDEILPDGSICPWALREGIILRHLETAQQPRPLSIRPLRLGADATVAALHPAADGS